MAAQENQPWVARALKQIAYGTWPGPVDKRISRLRVFLADRIPHLHGQIAATWTDTASTGICDYDAFARCCGGSCERAYAIIGNTLERSGSHGIAVLDRSAGAIMPIVSSGFGDGEFPVFELIDRRVRVGAEIEFIARNATYPFRSR